MGQRRTWQAVSSNTPKAHAAHTHALDISFMPASLPGTALGPEGPRCRRRMGVGGDASARGRGDRWDRERERQRWHSVLNVTMVLKIPANLWAGNDMTGGIGEEVSGGGRERWQAGKDGEERDGKGDNKEEETKGGRLGQRVGGGGGLDGKDETDGGKQRQHFSSLLKGLPLTAHDERQNGHPNKHWLRHSTPTFQHGAVHYTAPPGVIWPTHSAISSTPAFKQLNMRLWKCFVPPWWERGDDFVIKCETKQALKHGKALWGTKTCKIPYDDCYDVRKRITFSISQSISAGSATILICFWINHWRCRAHRKHYHSPNSQQKSIMQNPEQMEGLCKLYRWL